MRTYVVILFLIPALPLFAQSAAGRVSFLLGDVKILRNSEAETLKVRINLPVMEGDVVRTGKASRCEIELVEDRILRFDENANAQIVGSTEGRGKIHAKGGAVWVNMKKLVNRKNSLAVGSNIATAAIRGTVVSLNCGDGRSDFQVHKGEVSVASAVKSKSGKEVAVTVKAGEEFTLVMDFEKYMKDQEAELRSYFEQQEKALEDYEKEQEKALEDYEKSQNEEMEKMLEAERKAFISLEGGAALTRRKIDEKKLAKSTWAQWNLARDKTLGW